MAMLLFAQQFKLFKPFKPFKLFELFAAFVLSLVPRRKNCDVTEPGEKRALVARPRPRSVSHSTAPFVASRWPREHVVLPTRRAKNEIPRGGSE